MREAHRSGVELSTAKSANGAAQCFGAAAVGVGAGVAIAGVHVCVQGVEKAREGGEEVVLRREERDLRAPERSECVARADPGHGGDLDAAVRRRGVRQVHNRRGIGSAREVVGEEDVEARVEADGGARGGGPRAEGDEAVARRGEVVPGEERGEGERVRPGVDRAARLCALGGRRGRRGCRGGCRARGLDEEEAGFLECLAEGGHAQVGILAGIEVATGKGLRLALVVTRDWASAVAHVDACKVVGGQGSLDHQYLLTNGSERGL